MPIVLTSYMAAVVSRSNDVRVRDKASAIADTLKALHRSLWLAASSTTVAANEVQLELVLKDYGISYCKVGEMRCGSWT